MVNQVCVADGGMSHDLVTATVELAEQHLPPGAVVLRLQTIKKDGRVLEPEALGDKEGASLPDVQVGDYVDVEYLNAVRGALPDGVT